MLPDQPSDVYSVELFHTNKKTLNVIGLHTLTHHHSSSSSSTMMMTAYWMSTWLIINAVRWSCSIHATVPPWSYSSIIIIIIIIGTKLWFHTQQIHGTLAWVSDWNRKSCVLLIMWCSQDARGQPQDLHQWRGKTWRMLQEEKTTVLAEMDTDYHFHHYTINYATVQCTA